MIQGKNMKKAKIIIIIIIIKLFIDSQVRGITFGECVTNGSTARRGYNARQDKREGSGARVKAIITLELTVTKFGERVGKALSFSKGWSQRAGTGEPGKTGMAGIEDVAERVGDI